MRRFLFMIAVLALVGCQSRQRYSVESVDFQSLLERMANVAEFAQPPLGKSFLESSYDRTGGNADWMKWTSASQNAAGRIVLLDVDGPGYVSRIWIASFKAKRWLFFFDGEAEPRLSLTQAEIFNINDENRWPFIEPLAGVSGGGKYSLVPIAFEKHLRIEIEPEAVDPTHRNYVQINYTLVDSDVVQSVSSWPKQFSVDDSNTVANACATLSDRETQMTRVRDACFASGKDVEIAPGESVVLFDEQGAGCINAFAVKFTAVSGDAVQNADLLRKLRLKMWWEGAKYPSVDVPIGDFFFNPFYCRSYASYWLANLDGSYVSRIPMPYRKKAIGKIFNNSSYPVVIKMGVQVSEEGVCENQRLFHAKWSASATSGRPFLMASTSGSGHYVGCFLTAIGQDGSWNILEGDEYLSPDKGKQPVQYGTGLEDYFSGAYYYRGLFELPFHGLIEKGAMRTDQYRLHALDAVGFEDDFEIGIEFGDGNRSQGYMSSVVYWYADKPQDASLNASLEPLLGRPKDRFELAGFMAQLFTLERGGIWKDAGLRCEYMAARFARQPWSDLLRIRALAYRERLEGIDAVRDAYAQFIKSKFPPAARQASDLLWRHEKDTHALLGMHMRGKYTLFIDGAEVASGNSRAKLDVLRLDVSAGKHVWEVEFEPTMQGSLFSLCLRTQWGDITSEGDWEIVDAEPLPGRKVPDAFVGSMGLPNMSVWQFEPNAYPGMQCGRQGVELWKFWDGRPLVKRIRLRQAWTNDPEVVSSAPVNMELPERTEDELKAHTVD